MHGHSDGVSSTSALSTATLPEAVVLPATTVGDATGVLSADEVTTFVREQLDAYPVDGRSVCILVPDGTRTCPLPLLLKAVHASLAGRATRMTVLVALGTHAAMSDEALAAHLGYAEDGLEATFPGMTVLNHEWWDPETFADLGTIPAARIRELSEGRLDLDVPVHLNRAVVEHDIALVVGPVLPHEVVGISGGNKYFFPGVAGQDIIDISHWLGALITSAEIIGTTAQTPVRALIDEGASLIPADRLAFCVVGAAESDHGSPALHSVSFGDTIASWAAAAQVCAVVPMISADVIRAPSQCEMSMMSWPATPGKKYLLPPEIPTTSCGSTGPTTRAMSCSTTARLRWTGTSTSSRPSDSSRIRAAGMVPRSANVAASHHSWLSTVIPGYVASSPSSA